MNKLISLTDIADRLGAQMHLVRSNEIPKFRHVCIDTRTLCHGDLFIALRGENYDAHDFLPQAVEAGAIALVVEQYTESLQIPQLVVADTTLALGQVAKFNRACFHGRLIGITGSSGKTTVKGMVTEILNNCGSVYATPGNFNNHIGVPLSLLSLEERHDFAVIEMGASAVGEIDYLTQLAQPDIALVNNIMAAHVEGFGSVANIAKAKGEIFSGLDTQGTAVINLDSEYSQQLLELASGKSITTISLSDASAEFYAVDIKSREHSQYSFRLNSPQGQHDVHLQVMGVQNVSNALAAAAVSAAAGASLTDIVSGLESYKTISGRLSECKGINNSLVIDDTYNANPGSVKAAIDTLITNSPDKETVLVLGDLAELGEDSEALHKELGLYAKDRGVKYLITVGKHSQSASCEFGKNARHFACHSEAIGYLLKNIGRQMVLLVKGSRSARMELIVQAITQSGES